MKTKIPPTKALTQGNRYISSLAAEVEAGKLGIEEALLQAYARAKSVPSTTCNNGHFSERKQRGSHTCLTCKDIVFYN
jgi:hypothetical protein